MTGILAAPGVALGAVATAAAPEATGGAIGPGETFLFWVLAIVSVLAACGLIFARRAAYSAVSLVVVMIALAFMYTAQGAPFMGVTQVVVYTGAIMMLFLFVLMLVGVDAADSLHETIKNQRWVAVVAGLGLVIVLVGVAAQAVGLRDVAGLETANADSNPVGVARVLFGDYVFAMELTGALLITAALGAVVLTHAERLRPKVTQEQVAEEKMRAFAKRGGRIEQLPAPGVYARSNAADLPALSATGEPVVSSVPRVLRVRGQERTIGEVSPETVAAIALAATSPAAGVHGGDATRAVGLSGLPDMPGEAPPVPLIPGSPAGDRARLAAREAAAIEGGTGVEPSGDVGTEAPGAVGGGAQGEATDDVEGDRPETDDAGLPLADAGEKAAASEERAERKPEGPGDTLDADAETVDAGDAVVRGEAAAPDGDAAPDGADAGPDEEDAK
jgi:NADH-quinone oxidoreductase subunit J